MAKQVIPINNTPYDPYSVERQLIKNDPSSFRPAGEKVLGPNKQAATFSDVDLHDQPFSLLGGNDALASETINESLAANQSALGLTGKMLYNTAVTIGSEVAKLPGYVAGGVAAIGGEVLEATGAIDHFSGMETMVDNVWVNALETLSDEAKSAIPTYISKEVQEGGLMTKLQSGQWWATTGADGIGFLIGMMVPGQAIKLLGVGAKIAEGAAQVANKSARIGKMLSKSGKVIELMEASGESTGIFKASAAFGKSANHVAAATLNTFTESASEAGNTFDNVVKTKMAEGYSEEEAKQMAGNAAASVFKANMPLLMVSNMLDEAWFWKGFNTSGQKKITNEVLRDLIVKGELNPAIKKLGTRDLLSRGVKNLAKNYAKEGLLEEGLQTRFQQTAEEEGSVQYNDVLNPVNYFNTLMESVEMQESVFLGGFLGGGMSVIQTKNEIDNYNKQLFGTEEHKAKTWFGKLLGRDTMKQEGLANVVKEGFISNYKSIAEVAKRDKDGNLLLDDNKRIIVDEDKLAELAEDKAKLVHANLLYDQAVLEDDKLAQSILGTQLAYNSFQPFLAQEGGLEAFKQYAAKQLTDGWANQFEQTTGSVPTEQQREEYTKTMITQASKLQDIYNEVYDTHYPEKSIRIDEDEKPLFAEWKDKLFTQKISTLLEYEGVKDTESYLEKEKSLRNIPNEQELIAEIIAGQLTGESDTKLSPTTLVQLINHNKIMEKTPGYRKDLQERYKKFFDKTELQKSWDEFKAEKIERKDELTEEVTKVAEETAKKVTLTKEEGILINKKFMQDIKDGGYNVEEALNAKTGTTQSILKELVLAKDNNGKRYKILTRRDPKTGEIKNFAIDEKGKQIPLNAATINNLDLKVVSKADIALEEKAFKLSIRRNAMLQLMDRIINHKVKEHDAYQKHLEQVQKSIDALQDDVHFFELEVEKLLKEGFGLKGAVKGQNTKKLNKAKKALAELNKQIELLTGERDRLLTMRDQFGMFAEQYKQYKDLINESDVFSFKKENEKVDSEMFELYKKLSNDVDFSNSITATQKAIEAIDKQIPELNETIARLRTLRDLLRSMVQREEVIQRLALSAAKKGAESLDNIQKVLSITPRLNSLFKELQNQLKTGRNISDIVSDSSMRNRMYRVLQGAQDELALQGISPDETMKYILDNLIEYNEAKTNEEEFLGERTYEEIAAIQNDLVVTEQELVNLGSQLRQLNVRKKLQELNKQRIVLNEILQEKVQKEFSAVKTRLEEENLDPSQMQQEIVNEPSEDNSELSTIFFQRSLGQNMFATTGSNIQFDSVNKKDERHADGPYKGLPVLNPSQYQQVWFNTLDQIARMNTLGEYKIVIYRPQYDNSNKLEQAIATNNPQKERQTNSDLFAVLVDSNGAVVEREGVPVFTSIWKPEVLYKQGEPRLAPNTLFQRFLDKMRVASGNNTKHYNAIKDADNTIWKEGDQKIIRNTLGISEGVPFRVSDVYEAAVEDARKEYTAWYNKAVESNKQGKVVLVTPKGITKGHLVQRKTEAGDVIWNPVLGNVPGVSLQDKKFGPDQLQGAKIIQAGAGDKTGKRQITVDGQTLQVNAGDSVLVLQNEKNVVPLQARNINENEIKLVMYLMSLGVDQKFDAMVPLPKGTYYKVNGQEITDNVRVFAYTGRSNPLKNFSLLHTIINYGRKKETELNKEDPGKRKGEVFVGTNKQTVYYVDWDGYQKQVNLSELKQAVDEGKFAEFNESVSDFYKFLANKRFNISQNFVNSNGMFLMPKLKGSVKSGWNVEFETGKSYYDYLFGGKDPIVKTNAVQAKGYPMFAGRNIYFDSSWTEEQSEPDIDEPQIAEPDLSAYEGMDIDQYALSPEKAAILTGKTSGPTEEGLFTTEELNPEKKSLMDAFEDGLPATENVVDPLNEAQQSIGSAYADKILTPEEILKIKIQNKEIVQECL